VSASLAPGLPDGTFIGIPKIPIWIILRGLVEGKKWNGMTVTIFDDFDYSVIFY
jgi:hypothetical protein